MFGVVRVLFGTTHHGVEFRVVDEAILVLVGLFYDVLNLLLGNGLPHETQHDGQFMTVNVAITILS